MFLKCGKFQLPLARPLIMGVVNVTPDSFSDGGKFFELKQSLAHAEALISEGADILDIGGESTRPGAAPVPLEEERRRVLPLLERLAGGATPISIDTHKPELMREAVAAGVVVVVASRCGHGRTAPRYGYEGGGVTLQDAGAIFSGDLPAPKARIKLMVLLGAAAPVATIRESFERPGS